jgi:hypothetical protein
VPRQPRPPSRTAGRAGQPTHFDEHAFDGGSAQCTYRQCLSLLDFAAVLRNVQAQGGTDLLNTHYKPQHRVCFRDGATPERWDRVTTGHNVDALRELGAQLGDPAFRVEDSEFDRHSTADALLFGAKFEVGEEVLELLRAVTAEENAMLQPVFEAENVRSFQDDLQDEDDLREDQKGRRKKLQKLTAKENKGKNERKQ